MDVLYSVLLLFVLCGAIQAQPAVIQEWTDEVAAAACLALTAPGTPPATSSYAVRRPCTKFPSGNDTCTAVCANLGTGTPSSVSCVEAITVVRGSHPLQQTPNPVPYNAMGVKTIVTKRFNPSTGSCGWIIGTSPHCDPNYCCCKE